MQKIIITFVDGSKKERIINKIVLLVKELEKIEGNGFRKMGIIDDDFEIIIKLKK